MTWLEFPLSDDTPHFIRLRNGHEYGPRPSETWNEPCTLEQAWKHEAATPFDVVAIAIPSGD
ncbi:hypothetical protein [Sphingomonas ginsenosidimutans]|jgi:hypothetical protein|uniref:hypothetical protein n=1 Tax=Sphingomonas ginsenosidimutans TaxID=862134 RepID=UPI001E0C0629|nr:hypothetical protein [Sphingomonas ginsenosidimutans]MBY0301233.1 hypothetical protein [Sphingomonas ginsenosidimutans]